jgi:hypothetical protein
MYVNFSMHMHLYVSVYTYTYIHTHLIGLHAPRPGTAKGEYYIPYEVMITIAYVLIVKLFCNDDDDDNNLTHNLGSYI